MSPRKDPEAPKITPADRTKTPPGPPPWYQPGRLRPDFDEVARSGRPVLVVGRNSGEGGRQARDLAVSDIRGAVAALETFGIDIQAALPSYQELFTLLEQADTVRSRATPERLLRSAFVELPRPSHGAHFLLSTGTGLGVDEDGHQPAAERLARVIKEIRPCLIWARKFDRLTRNSFAAGVFLEQARMCGAWVGDAHEIFDPTKDGHRLMLLITAGMGEQNARTLTRNMPKRQAERTDRSMAAGCVQVAFGQHPPAGLVRVRLRDGAGQGESRFYFDAPQFHPDPAIVAYGMPEVRNPDGTRVDQVANVRWALSVMGRRGVTLNEVARTLAERGFSTNGLRAKSQNPEQTFEVWPWQSRYASQITNGIESQLAFYESGEIVFTANRDGGPVVITDCFPPDGLPWASPEDFARIAEWMRDKRREPGYRIGRIFSGIRLTCGGRSAVLSAGGTHAGGTQYMVREGTRYPQFANGMGGFHIAHDELVAMIREGVIAAGHVPMTLDVGTLPNAAERARVGALRHALEQQVSELERQRDLVYDKVVRADAVVDGPLLTRLSRDYAALESRVADTHAQLDETKGIESRLNEAHEAAIRVTALDHLLELVASLADPTDVRFASVWREILQDLVITATRVDMPGRFFVTDYHASATLVLSTGEGAEVRIPLERSWRRWRDHEASKWVAATQAKLRAGVPFPTIEGWSWALRLVMNGWLGGGNCAAALMANCDPAITMTVVNGLLVEPLLEPAELARNAGREVSWVDEVLTYWRHRKTKWFIHGPRPVKVLDLLALARDNEGTMDTRGWDWATNRLGSYISTDRRLAGATHSMGVGHLPPCPACDGYDFVLSRLPEPIGRICRECRRDSTGVLWPADPYAQYDWPDAP